VNSIHEYFVLIFSSTMNQSAILSDIHANIWALEAVLDDISRRGPAQLINLGDSLYGPLEPQATAAYLMQLPIVSILGNQDRILLEKPVPPVSPSLAYVLNDLAPSSLDWLAAQPSTRIVAGELLLCHGTPSSDQTYLLERMTLSGGFLQEPAAIQAQLGLLEQPVVLCGHSHIPRILQLPAGPLVINPGSVGLPAYSDDFPVAHKMETGSPHARYALVSKTAVGWTVEQNAVPYDWNKAAQKARSLGQYEWAAWLETGRA
jgi:predicted phosphodiesterase